MAGEARPAGGPPDRWLAAAVVLLFLSAATSVPQQVRSLAEAWPVIRRWSDPAEQQRLLRPEAVYDTLRQAEAILPRDAAVLLVSDGGDVRRREYVTFHRALYFLAPRPVWWMSPAPSDGSWESRWWIAAPLTAEAIASVARDRGVACLLYVGPALTVVAGQEVARLDEGTLAQVDGGPGACGQVGTAATSTDRPASPVWLLRLAAGLGVVLAVGYTLLALVRRLGYQAGGLEAAGLAWLLGSGALPAGLWALDRLGLGLARQLPLVATLSVVGFWWWARGRPLRQANAGRPNGTAGPAVPGRTAVPALLLAGWDVFYVLLLAAGRPLALWDSWVNFGSKARVIFLEGAVTTAVYGEPARAVTLLDYPLSVPLLEAWLYAWLAAPDDRLAGLLFFLSYLALLAVLYVTGRRLGLGAAGAVWLMALAGHPLSGLFAGALTDGLLAALATVAVIYALRWLEGGQPGVLAVAGLAAGLLPWTKREGLIIVAALAVVIVVAGRGRRRAWAGAGALALAAAVFAGPWWLFTAVNGITNDAFLALRPATFLTNLERLSSIAWRMGASLLTPALNLAWPVALGVALAVRRGARAAADQRRGWLLFGATAGLYLGLMSLTFVFSAYVPYQQHVNSAAFRLVGHVAALPALWLGYMAGEGRR